MRKLGIGKKKKKKRGDADDRTPAEMQADLKKGIAEATEVVKNGETDKKKLEKKFNKIENKYDLRIAVLRNSLNKITKIFLRKNKSRIRVECGSSPTLLGTIAWRPSR